ncbi:MAG TPA: hypothetical protein VI076_16110 [Actinopolymorphaceae bacterium]
MTRNPNWISDYCPTHHIMADRYHRIDSEQYVYLWLMTKQPLFVRLAELFRDDYPVAAVGGHHVEMAKGTHTGYKFDADSTVVGSKTITLTPPRHATRVHRATCGDTIWGAASSTTSRPGCSRATGSRSR